MVNAYSRHKSVRPDAAVVGEAYFDHHDDEHCDMAEAMLYKKNEPSNSSGPSPFNGGNSPMVDWQSSSDATQSLMSSMPPMNAVTGINLVMRMMMMWQQQQQNNQMLMMIMMGGMNQQQPQQQQNQQSASVANQLTSDQLYALLA